MTRGLLFVAFIVLTGCSSSLEVPSSSKSPNQSISMLTGAAGELGSALSSYDQSPGKTTLDNTGFGTGLVYVGVGETSVVELNRNSSFQAAIKDHRAILVERSPSDLPEAMAAITDTYFNFKGDGLAYVFRTLPDTDGGIAVYPVVVDTLAGASSSATTADRGTASLNSVLNIAGLAPSIRGDTGSGEQGELSIAGARGQLGLVRATPPGVAGLRGGILEWDYRTPLPQKTAYAPCFYTNPCYHIDYNSVFNRTKGYYLRDVAWAGNWIVCGGLPVVQDNSCTTGYAGTSMRTEGSETILENWKSEGEEGEVTAGIAGWIGATVKKRMETAETKGQRFYGSFTWTYSSLYNSAIKQGYRARFGRGDYRLHYEVVIGGRYEKSRQFFDTTNDTLVSVLNWNPNWRAVVGNGEAVAFGAMHWAICKNNDLKCVQAYDNINNARNYIERVFPL